MELALTPEQKDYLNRRGPFKAADLQRAYKLSVEEQQAMLKKAQQIRANSSKSK